MNFKADADVELSWKYLSRAFEGVERIADHLNAQARDFDTRTGCLPLAMVLLRDYASPILRKITLPEKGVGLLMDKIQFCKNFQKNNNNDGATDYQESLIKDWKRTIETIGELIVSDGVISNDGGIQERPKSLIEESRKRAESMFDSRKHAKLGEITQSYNGKVEGEGKEDIYMSSAENDKHQRLAQTVRVFLNAFM